MTPEQAQQVQSTWTRIAPASEEAAARFYGRLFEQYPETATLYMTEMAEQGRRFMHMMGFAVDALADPAQAARAIEDMGARHAAYGVIDSDYDKVTEAFLWTLGKQLGETFTPEIEAAWTCFFDWLADAMKAGAAQQKRTGLASGGAHRTPVDRAGPHWSIGGERAG